MTVAAAIFFARSHIISKNNTMGVGAWINRMLVLSVIGGPGAAISWAAVKREERLIVESGMKEA
jgi:hypothetical protein